MLTNFTFYIVRVFNMSTLSFTARYFLLLALLLFYVKISEIQMRDKSVHHCSQTKYQLRKKTLKCRSRVHMKQEEDFYYLVSKCLKESTNTSSNSTADASGHRDQQQVQLQRPLQPPITQIYEQQQQQQQQYQQQKQQQVRQRYPPLRDYVPNRKPNENYHYNGDQSRDNPFDANKIIRPPNLEFDYDNGERFRNLPNTCTCVSSEGQVHRYGFDERHRAPAIRYREERETISSQIHGRTNFTTKGPTAIEKSPLENIDALNDENKVDRQSMLLILTLHIQDPELKEFIEDSIDECYDFLDTGIRTDNREELCNISKKLSLCLEERAKRACDDWEVREEIPIYTAGFNASKNFERYREDENRYTTSNGAHQGDLGSKNGNNKWNPNFSPPRKYN